MENRVYLNQAKPSACFQIFLSTISVVSVVMSSLILAFAFALLVYRICYGIPQSMLDSVVAFVMFISAGWLYTGASFLFQCWRLNTIKTWDADPLKERISESREIIGWLDHMQHPDAPVWIELKTDRLFQKFRRVYMCRACSAEATTKWQVFESEDELFEGLENFPEWMNENMEEVVAVFQMKYVREKVHAFTKAKLLI